MNASHIDAFEFCRLKQSQAGEDLVANFPRLSAEIATKDGSVHWSVEGSVNEQGYSQLILKVASDVHLMCQRCLTPFVHRLESASVLVLAPDEASADEFERLIDDDAIDVIVAAQPLSIADLVEDEALLLLPQSPRHQECPRPALEAVPAQLKDKAPSPFDVLKNWKQ